MSTRTDLSPAAITIHTTQRPSVDHLPVELLSHIFCFAVLRYDDRNTGFLQLDFARRALCGVSSLWRSIVVSIPKLWTTVVNFANVPYHWSTVENWIPLSHNLPLDLILTRSRHVPSDELEGAYVQTMLGLAIPHFSRLRRLHVDVQLSSSLPSIENHFVWCMPSLVSLTLQCDLDDGPYKEYHGFDAVSSSFSLLHQHSPSKQFSCPLLETMIVDGENFRYICQQRPEWTDDLDNLSELTVSHFDENEDFAAHFLEISDIVDFLADLPTLNSLTFEDVNFDFTPSQPPNQVPLSNVSYLEIKDLDGKLLIDLLYHCDWDNLDMITITNCVLDDENIFPLFCQHLYLNAIGVDGHLSSLLQSWNGATVHFANCPGYDDVVLETLGSVNPDDPSEFNASWLEGIISTGCSNFSIEALKRLVERRNRTVDYADPEWWKKVDAPKLDSIIVEGYGSDLSTGDREWFERHLREFSWNGVGCCRGTPLSGILINITHRPVT